MGSGGGGEGAACGLARGGEEETEGEEGGGWCPSMSWVLENVSTRREVWQSRSSDSDFMAKPTLLSIVH